MWHKAEWMGRPMRLELTRIGLLVQLANRYTTRGALTSIKLLVIMFWFISVYTHTHIYKRTYLNA